MDPRASLRDWLDKREIAPGSFARTIGYDRSNFHHMMEGRFDPSIALAHKIEVGTSGAVPMAAWAKAKAA